MRDCLKRSGKGIGLFVLTCTLLLIGFQHSTTIAYAEAGPDMYIGTSLNQVWGHSPNGTGATLYDDGNTEGVVLPGGGVKAVRLFPLLEVVVARMGGDIFERRGQYILQLEFGDNCPANARTNLGGFTDCLVELDDNPTTIEVAAAGNGLVYQLHTDGSIWQATGECYHCWKLIGTNSIDPNSQPLNIVSGGTAFFQLRNDSTVWSYNSSSSSWTEIDFSPSPTVQVAQLAVDNNGVLYELRRLLDSAGNVQQASTAQYSGSPFIWTTLGSTPTQNDSSVTNDILTSSSRLYQSHSDGSLWAYNDDVNNPSFIKFDNGSGIIDIAAGGQSDTIYKELTDKSVWAKFPSSSQYTLVSAAVSGQIVFLAQPAG